jgi:hypothetical protein
MAKVIFQDEEGQNLNRYLITPTDGSAPFTADLVRAATITKQGTPYNKEVGDHFLQTEDGAPVQVLTCTKTDTVYALAGLTATAGVIPCAFQADAPYAAGDTFTVDGAAYSIQTSSGSALASGAFVAGAIVPVILDIDAQTINIKGDPTIPVKLPNPAALTMSKGYGGQTGTYDGSVARSISIPQITISASSPGALSAGDLWGVY